MVMEAPTDRGMYQQRCQVSNSNPLGYLKRDDFSRKNSQYEGPEMPAVFHKDWESWRVRTVDMMSWDLWEAGPCGVPALAKDLRPLPQSTIVDDCR